MLLGFANPIVFGPLVFLCSDEGYDSKAADGVAEMRDVFGDSDEEQEPEDRRHNQMHEEVQL
jgi:hypothetical protein